MHPMLQLTVFSCTVAFLFAVSLPLLCRWIWPDFRKPLAMLFLAGIVAVILGLTLHRTGSDVREINFIPFSSYRKWAAEDIRWQIMMNIALFVPLGAVLYQLRLRPPQAILTGLCLSLFIELMQYCFALGLCEADDLINNTLGTVIGYVICWLFSRILPSEEL